MQQGRFVSIPRCSRYRRELRGGPLLASKPGSNLASAEGHVGASIQEAWTTSLDHIRAGLDADPALDRTVILRAVTQELGPTREAVLEAVMQRLDLSQKHAAEAYTLAEQFETNPRSVWGYVQGLTRLSQHTPWQDGRFAVDRAASRLLTSVC